MRVACCLLLVLCYLLCVVCACCCVLCWCVLFVVVCCWLLVDCSFLSGVHVAKRVICRVMFVVVCHVFYSLLY